MPYLTSSGASGPIQIPPCVQCARFWCSSKCQDRKIKAFHRSTLLEHMMEQHKTPHDAASRAVVPLLHMHAGTSRCQRNSQLGICEMEQWNTKCNEVKEPVTTRFSKQSKRSIKRSIILERWNTLEAVQTPKISTPLTSLSPRYPSCTRVKVYAFCSGGDFCGQMGYLCHNQSLCYTSRHELLD